MRYRRLDLNLLVALDALLIDQSVTRAAAKLNITQPAVSGALARLREYFDDPLIIQIGRQMELTSLAQSLVEPIHDIMMRIDSVIATDPAFDPKNSKRHFTIMASDYVIQIFLQEVLARLSTEAPGVTFELRPFSARVREELDAGEVDFVIGPETDVLNSHPSQMLFDDTFSVIAWKNSKAIGSLLTFDEYTALKHVVFMYDNNGAPWFERWFSSQYGDVRQIDIIAPNFLVVPNLIVDTDRIATIPTRLAKQFLAVLPLKIIPAPIEFPILRELIQWNVHRDPNPASQWLRHRLKEHALTMPTTELQTV